MSTNKDKGEIYKNIARKIAGMEVKYRPELANKYVQIDGDNIKYEENRFVEIYSDLMKHNININQPDTHNDYLDATNRIIEMEIAETPELLNEDIVVNGQAYDYIEGRSIEILDNLFDHSLSRTHGKKYSKYADTCAQLMDPGGRVRKDKKTGRYIGSKDIDPKTGKFKQDLIPHCAAKMYKNDEDFNKVSMLTKEDYERGSSTIQGLKNEYLRYDAIDRAASKIDNFKYTTIDKAMPFISKKGLDELKYNEMSIEERIEFDKIRNEKKTAINNMKDAFKRSGKYNDAEIKKMIKKVENQPIEENIPDNPINKKIYMATKKKGIKERDDIRNKYKSILMEEKRKSDIASSIIRNKDIHNFQRDEKKKEWDIKISNTNKDIERLKNEKMKIREKMEDRRLAIEQKIAGTDKDEDKDLLIREREFLDRKIEEKETKINKDIDEKLRYIKTSEEQRTDELEKISLIEKKAEDKLKVADKIHSTSEAVNTISNIQKTAVGSSNKGLTIFIVILVIILIVIITIGFVFLLIGGLWGMALIIKNNPEVKGIARLYLMMYGFTMGWVYVIYSAFKYGWRSIV